MSVFRTMKQFFGKKSRSAFVTILTVSFVLHVVALLVFGTIKLFAGVLREDPVLIALPVDTPPVEEKEDTRNLEQQNRDTPPPSLPVFVVNNPSDLPIPALELEVDIDSSAVFSGRGGNGFGDGIGKMREKTVHVGRIFDRDIEAKRLGVILDVSFSTHGVINSVIEEIQSDFPDALIVFAPGCGIDDRKSEIVPISEYEKTAKKFPGGKYVTTNFVPALLKREGFEKIWKQTERRNNGYVVFAEVQGQQGCAGSDVAMKFLVDNGADVIYWFADFNDRVDPEVAENAAGYLRRKGAKLMIHDFVAPLPGKGRVEVLQSMADRTRGELFLKEFTR